MLPYYHRAVQVNHVDHRQHNRNTFMVRKCLLVLMVFIFTCFSLHFRGRLQDNNNKIQLITKNDKDVSFDDDQQQQQQYAFAIAQEEKIKSNQSIKNVEQQKMQTKITNLKRTPRAAAAQQEEAAKTNSGSLTKLSTKSPVIIPLLEAKTNSCTPPAYMEFPPDLFGNRGRARGAVVVHIAVVLYMFYCLAVVCENYFLPSLEECSQRLKLSDDVAGATFMAAGSSAPELFTAILGVFIAKGDVGTGTIVGSAVFNILFVIGLCSLYTVSTELNWWPVARDSAYYTFTVLILIMCIYDGEVTTLESFILLLFYGVYIVIMNNNVRVRDFVLQQWESRFQSLKPSCEASNSLKSTTTNDAQQYQSFQGNANDLEYGTAGVQYNGSSVSTRNPFVVRQPEVTIFEAANQIIIKHKRLFRAKTRFRSAAYLIIIRYKKAKEKENKFGRTMSMDSVRHMSHIGPDDELFWRKVPDPNVDSPLECVKWTLMAPLHAVLFYTIPNCKQKSNMFLVTFLASITWTAIFSYIMVWMVTLIGFTFGIPDSIMGITFLAAGTSVPDAYASLHVAKLGQADMAVSNSIGSNVFDILVGLALPWFVETAIVDTGSVSSINSRGLVYAVVLLFLSLLITIWLFHRHRWTLNPQLGYSLLFTYAAFLVFSSALEFNLFGYVNPPICGE